MRTRSSDHSQHRQLCAGAGRHVRGRRLFLAAGQAVAWGFAVTTPILTAEQAAEVMLLAYAYRHGATSDALEAHLRSLTAPAPAPTDQRKGAAKPGETWRHYKGGLYRFMTHGLLESDMTPVCVYQEADGDTVWVRTQTQFYDGRFCMFARPDTQEPQPFDPESLIRAVLPGGHSCDPQAVADDIREWARVHAAAPAHPWQAEAGRLREALAQQPPEFTPWAHCALLWVLWHHQGGSSKVGQPIRFALGMGAHDRLNDVQVADAKRWAALAESATTGKDAA